MVMLYDEPVRLHDGRWFAKVSDKQMCMVPINRTVIHTPTPWDQYTDVQIQLIDPADVTTIQKWESMCMADAWFHFLQSLTDEDEITSNYHSALEGITLEAQPSCCCCESPSGSGSLILQYDGIWFLGKSFGPVWKIKL